MPAGYLKIKVIYTHKYVDMTLSIRVCVKECVQHVYVFTITNIKRMHPPSIYLHYHEPIQYMHIILKILIYILIYIYILFLLLHDHIYT
jgi:hypothetical protein